MSETLSYPATLSLAKIAKGKRSFHLAVSDDQCAEIAARLELAAVNKLKATVSVEDRGRAKGVFLDGLIEADLLQFCALSMEPHGVEMNFTFQLRLVGGEELERLDEAEAYLDPEVDEYDALEGEAIELGEIIVQSLSMEIDPHAKFVELEDLDHLKDKAEVNAGPEKKPNPFAELEKLKKNS